MRAQFKKAIETNRTYPFHTWDYFGLYFFVFFAFGMSLFIVSLMLAKGEIDWFLVFWVGLLMILGLFTLVFRIKKAKKFKEIKTTLSGEGILLDRVQKIASRLNWEVAIAEEDFIEAYKNRDWYFYSQTMSRITILIHNQTYYINSHSYPRMGISPWKDQNDKIVKTFEQGVRFYEKQQNCH